MVQPVDLVVAAGDLSRSRLVLVDQGLEDVVHLPDRQLAHQPELGPQLPVGQRHQRAGHARDANRVVTHALQLGGDVLHAHQVAQVARDRLLRGDDHEDLLAHLAEELVQVLVVGAHLLRGAPVPAPQGVEGCFDLRLDERAHADK